MHWSYSQFKVQYCTGINQQCAAKKSNKKILTKNICDYYQTEELYMYTRKIEKSFIVIIIWLMIIKVVHILQ